MKKILRTLLLTLIITSMVAPVYINAEEIEVKKKLIVPIINDETEISMIQGGDITGELPPIGIFDENGRAEGTFTYPNYDNTRLGVWDLEWVFTPTDPNYEPVSGTIRLNVRAPEPELTEEPTSPSLTATTVLLDTMTVYDINLNDKVSGSSYLWTSSDTEIVEVNPANGKLKAIKEGKTNVTCEITFPDTTTQTLVSEVTVGYDENAPVLTETILDLETGDYFDINLENKVAKSKYRWVSSDRGVVTVNSANGKVTAIGAGTAYVTCTITTPENQVIVLRCDINVTAPVVVTE